MTVNHRLRKMAGFEVINRGWVWVISDSQKAQFIWRREAKYLGCYWTWATSVNVTPRNRVFISLEYCE